MITNIISGIGMIGVAFGFAALARTRLGRVWVPLLIGAGLWVLTVALKFAWAIPINTTIYSELLSRFGDGTGKFLFWIYVGLLTGVFECGVFFLVFKLSKRLRAFDSDKALAVGVGFGAIEALLLGLVALTFSVIASIAPDMLAEGVAKRIVPIGWTKVPAGTIERLLAILIHIYTCYAVAYAIKTGALRHFWYAFILKTGVDSVAVWAQLDFGIQSTPHLWVVEAIIAVFALISVFGIVHLRASWRTIV